MVRGTRYSYASWVVISQRGPLCERNWNGSSQDSEVSANLVLFSRILSLMFPTAELTASGLPILITDHLEAPAEFLLYRTITEHLKARKQNRCILLSMSNDLPRWKSIFAKSVCALSSSCMCCLLPVEQNINLDLQINSGLFKFVDLLTYLQPAKLTTSPLVPLFNLVKEYIGLSAGQESRDLVVFDDTSSLEWLGHSTIDSTRFIRAMCSICSEVSLEIRSPTAIY